MRRVLIVFVGGGLGSCLRALLLASLAPWSVILPLPVLLANVTGAFILGIIFVLADEAGVFSAHARLFLAVGMLGGFTTFSTYLWGSYLLLSHAAIGAALLYIAASLIGAVAGVSGGLIVGREIIGVLERMAVLLLTQLSARGLRRIADSQADMAMIETEDREEHS